MTVLRKSSGILNGLRLSEIANIQLRQKAVRDADKLTGLGVRDIPIFSYPIYEIPRRPRKNKPGVFINKIKLPLILAS